jgi:hypothetical protein
MAAQKWMNALMAVALLAVANVASAQQSVSASDIQRLQDQVFQASSDVSRLRSTDQQLAGQLETELEDLRDEVVYLKVKLRKDGTVNRSDYADLRDRLQDLRSRARREPGAGTRAPEPPPASRTGSSPERNAGVSGGVYDDRRPASSNDRRSIPSGHEIDVRLQTLLSSDRAQVEDRFEATTAADLYRGNEVLIPAGSLMRGVVSSVNRASRTDRKGQLTIAFDQITVGGRTYPLRGTVTEALESEGIRGEAGRIGAGSAVGAIIGGIMGGVKGALLGVLIGGGGTIAATEGKDVTLPPGTILRVRLDTPPDIR